MSGNERLADLLKHYETAEQQMTYAHQQLEAETRRQYPQGLRVIATMRNGEKYRGTVVGHPLNPRQVDVRLDHKGLEIREDITHLVSNGGKFGEQASPEDDRGGWSGWVDVVPGNAATLPSLCDTDNQGRVEAEDVSGDRFRIAYEVVRCEPRNYQRWRPGWRKFQGDGEEYTDPASRPHPNAGVQQCIDVLNTAKRRRIDGTYAD